LEGNQGVVSALAFSPNGKHLASGDVGFFSDISVEIAQTPPSSRLERSFYLTFRRKRYGSVVSMMWDSDDMN